MSTAPARKVAAPMGMLMKKIQCQLRAWVTYPPISRPKEPPPTATMMYELMALARSAGWGKSATMMARMTEDDKAAPRPWTNRATMRRGRLSAAPQAAEAKVNRATPTRKTFFRPMRSPSRPANSRMPAKVMR